MHIKVNNIKYTIELYKESDLESFIDIFTDGELCKYMAGGAFENTNDAKKLFYFLIDLNKENSKNKAYGIYKKDELIGHFETNTNTFTKKNEIEIVYLLKKNYWGKGIMKEIIFVFNSLLKENLVARIKFNNINSIKLLKKIGIAKQSITNFNDEKVFKVILNKTV